jgi:DNA-binding NtrC family response regulator
MKGFLSVPHGHHSILVAEFDRDFRQSLVRSLERDGFSVYEAQAAREVIEFARKRIVDVLIMEMELPDLDGPHTLRMVNQIVGPVPCIFIGADVTKEMWMNALTEHAFALLVRPFDDDVFRRTVRDLVCRHFGPPLI